MDSKGTTRPVARPVITPGRCTGCGWCVAACPDHLLCLQAHDHIKSAELALPALCTGCAKCIPACNFGAIRMARQPACGSAHAGEGRQGLVQEKLAASSMLPLPL